MWELWESLRIGRLMCRLWRGSGVVNACGSGGLSGGSDASQVAFL